MDLKTQYIQLTVGEPPVFDLVMEGPDLALDGSLQNAVLLSTFTNRRATAEDDVAVGDDPQGYFAAPDWGSRWWTMIPQPLTSELLLKARDVMNEAFEWLVTEGIATSVTVTPSSPGNNILAADVVIEKPDGTLERYQPAWNATQARLVGV